MPQAKANTITERSTHSGGIERINFMWFSLGIQGKIFELKKKSVFTFYTAKQIF